MDSRRTRIIAFLVLAILAGSPGLLLAGCADCHPCCRPMSVPSVGASSGCPTLQAATPEQEGLPGTVPSAPIALVAATAAELPGETVAGLAPEPLPDSPPLHEGIGLFTLHATFLI